MRSHQLLLHEQVLLVALHDEKGTAPQPNTDLAVAASVLHELLRAGRLELVPDKKKSIVQVADSTVTGEQALDEALVGILGGKTKRLEWWVQRLGGKPALRHTTARGLVDRGVLEVRDGGFFGLGADRYPERDGAPEAGIRARVGQAVLTDGYVDEPTRTLVVVLDAADLLTKAVDRKSLRSRKARLKELREGDEIGDALAEALQAIQAAIISATTAAT